MNNGNLAFTCPLFVIHETLHMKLKSLIAALFLLLAIVPGCKDNPTTSGTATEMSGTIESWQSDGNDNLYLAVAGPSGQMLLDSTRIAADGSFSITVPLLIPPESILRRFSPLQDSSSHLSTRDERLFSNTNVKYSELELLVFDRHHVSRFLYMGNSFASSDSSASVGDYRVAYYYFSEATTISGRYALTYYDTLLIRQNGHSMFMTNYDLIVTAGWNAIKTKIVSDDGHIRTFEITAGDDSQKKCFAAWFLSRAFELASTL